MTDPAAPTLNEAQLHSLFPFHLAFDRTLTATSVGPSLRKICPRLATGQPIAGAIEIERPKLKLDFDSIAQSTGLLFLTRVGDNALRLRGQMMRLPDQDQLIYLCSPWLPQAGVLKSLGLTLDDFPLHDAMPELLQVVQSQSLAMEDLKRLADKLRLKGEALKQSNQLLQESESNARRLLGTLNATLEATTDGILVADLQQQIVAFNQRFLTLFNLPDDQGSQRAPGLLRSLVLSQLADPEEFEARILWLYQHPEESSEDLIRFRDGRIYQRESHPQRVGGSIVGRVWSYRDVSEKWRADEEIRESEERYRVVAETASDAILTTDAQFNILFANQAAGRMFGCPAKDLEGVPLSSLTAIPGGPAALTSIDGHGREVVGLCLDGREIQLEATTGQAHRHGQLIYTIFLRDISQRKLVESQLQQAMLQSEAANRAKSDFLANVSHEIRTPLNTIVGLAELVSETKLDTDQREMLSTVRSSSEALLHLINDLLDISKIEAGQIDLNHAEFDPIEVGEQAIAVLQLRAASKKLEFYFVVEPFLLPGQALGPTVYGDANRLRQVLINLLSNAVKFTDHGAVQLRLDWRKEDDGFVACRYTVTDSGVGITKELQQRIFEKFFRIDSEAGRKAGGVGLGLSISRLISEAMGGELSVESTPGVGTSFQLLLPLPGMVSNPRRQPSLASTTILLLASPSQLSLMRQALQSSLCQIIAFDNVTEAFEYVRHHGAVDFLAIDEQCGISEEEVQGLVRQAMLGKPIRTLRLQQGREALTRWRLPGRTESLEFPITPTRITRRLLRLLQDQRDVPDEPLRPPVRSTLAAAASVLLVEDNWAGQVYARRVLERDGHHVSVASTGREALAQTQAQKFDVILMDLMLPDANGFEVTRQIRQAEQARGVAHTPILALTAHALETFRQEALAAGMDDYLTKPVRLQTLLDAVAHWAPPARPAPTTSSPPAACFEVDPDLADLVPLFLEKVRQQAAALAEMAAQKNFAEIAKLGHNWKGTGSLYGFHPLSQLGRKLEEAAHAQDLPAINQLAEQLLGWLQDLKWQPRREH